MGYRNDRSLRRATGDIASGDTIRVGALSPSVEGVARSEILASALERMGMPMTYVAGRTIIVAGSPIRDVFRVVQGVVRAVLLLTDGRRCITNFFTAGDFIGLFEAEDQPFAFETVTDVRLTRYLRRSFVTITESDPGMEQRVLALMIAELSETYDRMMLLARKSALERIATFLLTMGNRTGGTEDGENVIPLPMTRDDIADHLGLAHETVSRSFSLLVGRRIVRLPKFNRVIVLDRRRLEGISAGTSRASASVAAAATSVGRRTVGG